MPTAPALSTTSLRADTVAVDPSSDRYSTPVATGSSSVSRMIRVTCAFVMIVRLGRDSDDPSRKAW